MIKPIPIFTDIKSGSKISQEFKNELTDASIILSCKCKLSESYYDIKLHFDDIKHYTL